MGVLICVLLLGKAINIDPLTAVRDKLTVSSAKYAVDKSKGGPTKYTNLSEPVSGLFDA